MQDRGVGQLMMATNVNATEAGLHSDHLVSDDSAIWLGT